MEVNWILYRIFEIHFWNMSSLWKTLWTVFFGSVFSLRNGFFENHWHCTKCVNQYNQDIWFLRGHLDVEFWLSVDLSVWPFGLDSNIKADLGCSAVKYCKDIQGPQRMNPIYWCAAPTQWIAAKFGVKSVWFLHDPSQWLQWILIQTSFGTHTDDLTGYQLTLVWLTAKIQNGFESSIAIYGPHSGSGSGIYLDRRNRRTQPDRKG